MPLTGNVSQNISELTHHGTRQRSHKEIVAIAIAAARRKGKFAKALESYFQRRQSRMETEPLKTKGIVDPVRLDRGSLHELIARAAERVHPTPSDKQRKAGNYRMGHVTIHGMDITIESPTNSIRKGKGKDGKPWEVVMKNHYGYIKRTESEADRDHVDVFVGPNPESEIVFVIDQNLGGRFDEHKCMVGFTNGEDAKKAYHANYSEGWEGFGNMRPLTIDQFKKWVKKGHTHIPIARQVLTFNADPVKLAKLTEYLNPLMRSTNRGGMPSAGWEHVTDKAATPSGSGPPHTAAPAPVSSPSAPSPSESSQPPSEPSSSPWGANGAWPSWGTGPHASSAPAVAIDSEDPSRIQSHSNYPGMGNVQRQYNGRTGFLHPDILYEEAYGPVIDTFVAPTPDEVYRSPGRNTTHYDILKRMRQELPGQDIPHMRSTAVNNDMVLGRTGNVLGHRVTSFWNNSYQEDAVKAYVLQQIKEGKLHPDHDLIAFRGAPGLVRAGDFVGHTSTPEEKEQRKWTPEELARAHIDPALKAEILGSAARKFPKNPWRDAMVRMGLLAPGHNWRSPLEAQRPGTPSRLDRPLPDWVPQEDPDHPTPENTGWAPVQSSWIGGLKYTPDTGVEMMVKKGGKHYPYPGFNLAMFRRWLASKSPGKWWWRNVGYPMQGHSTFGRIGEPIHLSIFTGKVHPIFAAGNIDHPPKFQEFNRYTPDQIMDWARRHVHPQITPAHLSALIGWLPGAETHVHSEGPIGYGHQLAGHEPTELTFSTDAPGYSTMRTIFSKNVNQNGVPHVHNEFSQVDPTVPGPTGGHVPNPYRGVSGPALLRQMRAAHELGIPKIDWHAAWSEPGDRAYDQRFDYSGGLHWPLLGAEGFVPKFHEIPDEIKQSADAASGGLFSHSWLFSDFFKSPEAKEWYTNNPSGHQSWVDTTPGSYSRTAIERHVGENAARHGMEGPIPDAHMMQQPLPRNAAEGKMQEPEEETQPRMTAGQRLEKMKFCMRQHRPYHPGVEHLIATGSVHPEHFDLAFNK